MKRATSNQNIKSAFSPSEIFNFVNNIVGEDLHAKRVLSISNGVLGILSSAVLGIHAIGKGLAAARGLRPKHTIKQIDRLLSNDKFDVWEIAQHWLNQVTKSRAELVIAIDWTTFDKDQHQMLGAYLITSHGRARPLFWKSFRQSEWEQDYYKCLESALIKLRELIPQETKVTILADRGFGYVKFFKFLRGLGFHYVIRMPSSVKVTSNKNERRKATEWILESGYPKLLKKPNVSLHQYQCEIFVAFKGKNMKEPWCISSSLSNATASKIIKLYSRRFTIEESFRDLKDPRFGMGLLNTRIANPMRRDRLIFLQTIAIIFLTILGNAGEESGYGKYLKANTSKKRTLSLLNQGLYYYAALPNMPKEDLGPIMQLFEKQIANHPVFKKVFEVI